MAIFIALFFQVLFVFFAMAINVGMVVHDKINLQNAVDIAAYYGAARQAEILNQIAHINYQMRQNYKLFVWRYRVLGTLGLQAHPLNVANPTNTLQGEANASTPPTFLPIVPSVCVAHKMWQEYNDLDYGASMCRAPSLTIANIQPITGAAGFLSGIGTLSSFAEKTKRDITRSCLEAGILNWKYSARMLAHFRVDGYLRKRMIKKLASNLSSPAAMDLRNESIETGVRNTMDKNLTNTNFAGVTNFQYFNSMSTGPCADPNTWLPEIKINPVIRFSDFRSVGSAENCEGGEAVPNRAMGTGRPAYAGFDNLPSGLRDGELNAFYGPSANELLQHWAGEPSTPDLHSSIGFEKNPWCMVYSGVSATSQVRKPFSPMGGTVTLQARGFAKPFGGRIGPWYGKQWPQGSPNSVATNRPQMVDPLLPSRDVPGGGGTFDPNDDVANYSRYPGDVLGYNSYKALTAMIGRFKAHVTSFPSGSRNAPLAWGTYNHLGGLPTLQGTGDSLARDVPGSPNKLAHQRVFESAALAPDVFDAFYYSIEPSYFANYFSDVATNNGALFPDSDRIYDFGSSKDGAFPMANGIREQIEESGRRYDSGADYIISDWKNLLTSWHQKGAVDFQMDPNQFGKCLSDVKNQSFPNPGNCIDGGRTGYSVKNVSQHYLQEDMEIGGSGATGKILNPPPF